MARHSAALKAVEPPVETGVVNEPRQVDIEATVAESHEHDAATAAPVADAPAADLVPTPAKRGRKPRAVAVDAIMKLVPVPVPVGTVPTPPMSVAAALALIPQGAEMTILGATWHEVNAAADELGIRAHVWDAADLRMGWTWITGRMGLMRRRIRNSEVFWCGRPVLQGQKPGRTGMATRT